VNEYKSLVFVIVDPKGTISRLDFDKEELATPNFNVKGDPALLLKRWSAVSRHIENYLKEQIK